MSAPAKLYTFWRSSAAYRVRIALGIKGLAREDHYIHFRKDGGQHRKPEFLSMNPQGLVPVWEEDGWCLNQSLAIIEYLDDTHPEPPLLPADVRARAEVRAMAQVIACEVHPLNNLRVLQYLRGPLAQQEDSVIDWIQHWVQLGFETLEARLAVTAGKYSFGDELSLVDVCLVPQVYSAERFGCELSRYPLLIEIATRLRELDAFQAALPENQPDAEA